MMEIIKTWKRTHYLYVLKSPKKMKKHLRLLLAPVAVFLSCGGPATTSDSENDSTATAAAEPVNTEVAQETSMHAMMDSVAFCPMHPGITLENMDQCPECGGVPKYATYNPSEIADTLFFCPMHPHHSGKNMKFCGDCNGEMSFRVMHKPE